MMGQRNKRAPVNLRGKGSRLRCCALCSIELQCHAALHFGGNDLG